MSLASCICLFFLCSFVGWAFESVHAIVKLEAWERRGFLYTPICPIYGVGVVGIILLIGFLDSEFNTTLAWWLVFILATLTSAVLEYATSWTLEKLFHAKWWDYSDMPFNLNGRICLPASLLFGAGGLASIYVVYPLWSHLLTIVPSVVIEILAFAVVALLSADTALTISALTNFSASVAQFDKNLNNEMETLVNEAFNDREAFASDIEKGAEETFERAKKGAETALEEARDAASSTLNKAKEELEAHLLHERNARFEEKSTQLANSLSSSHQAAISRVKSFQSDSLNNAKTKVEEVKNK